MELKDFRDKRGASVKKILKIYLDEGDFTYKWGPKTNHSLCILGDLRGYNQYMDTMCKLIREKRDVEDKIQLGEQMVQALSTINL